ncbi:GNAT family N-acetyltransferase [Kribbella albertanoniae]|uniref:GNAT family N-acetyltransferase n=1 Tax=Kribbella albertanoniae TaxID=1266829 RepID=A0A4R4PQR7_9ACTN|nr:GNAT family N-acetyltransferase [Kribbella albertanoniae]TDC24627.1 GNAT family N-acetyltransferase [Kribbella albertanoniae]
MDPVRRWMAGWRLCRGLEQPVEYDDVLLAQLGLPGREREMFTLTDDPALIDRLAPAATETTWLTVTTQYGDAAAARMSAAGLQPFAEHKVLMSIALPNHPQPTTPPPYKLSVHTDGPLDRVQLLSPDGTIAARGMMATVGTDAVMHDIHTDPDHRRRGLGSVVMGALSRRALDRGAHDGLLMATEIGVQLYRSLGWLPEATMVTASGSASAVRGDLGAVLASC